MILEAGYTSAISFEVYRVSITYYRKPGRLLGKFVGIGATTSIAGATSFLVQVLLQVLYIKVRPRLNSISSRPAFGDFYLLPTPSLVYSAFLYPSSNL